MFGELPKLFDRDFAIAYFLPSAAFVAVTYLIVIRFGLSPTLFTLSADTFLKDLAAFGSVSLFGGIILLIANRGIVRLLEGYWGFVLRRHLNWLERLRFQKAHNKSLDSDQDFDAYDLRGEPFPRHLKDQRNQIKLLEASRFPDAKYLILPTSFGNIFRAFEVYARVMYGLDAIPGWFRLLAVIPKEYRALIDSARARVDFCVNFAFLSLFVIVEFYLAAILAKRLSVSGFFSPSGRFPWIPLFALLSFWMAYVFAKRAAQEWGEWVKSAYDLYLPDLRAKLEFAPVATQKEEREMWTAFTIAALTRDPEWMPEKIRKPPEPPTAFDKL